MLLFYYLLAYLILCGFVNAVNLTDGLDGLASSVMIPVSLLFSVVGLFLYLFTDLSTDCLSSCKTQKYLVVSTFGKYGILL